MPKHTFRTSATYFFFSGPSHSLELEQGTLGVGPVITRTQNVRTGPESQLLPSHLKCGMWASLALATVFVAGKFEFKHKIVRRVTVTG